MKHTLITFVAIFLLALVSVSVFNMMGTDGLLLASAPSLSGEDKKLLNESRARMFKAAAAFDEQFYKSMAGDEASDKKAARRHYSENILKVEPEILTSHLLNELLFRANTYMRNAMDTKSRVLSDSLSEKDFVVAFDSINYNYTAAEAVMRIIDKISITDGARRFVPDEVAESAIQLKSCVADKKDDDSYESSMAWFISANALKASFDVLYLQVLFGKPFYSENELMLINRRMAKLLKTMELCTPPAAMGGNLKAEYMAALTVFSNKRKLAEYRSFVLFQDNDVVMKMIDSVYSSPDVSSSVVRTVGYDAFQTLGIITLFELYSQNYKP